MKLIMGYHFKIWHSSPTQMHIRIAKKPYWFKISNKTRHTRHIHKYGQALVATKSGEAKLVVIQQKDVPKVIAKQRHIGQRHVVNFWSKNPKYEKLLKAALQGKPRNSGITVTVNIQKEVD